MSKNERIIAQYEEYLDEFTNLEGMIPTEVGTFIDELFDQANLYNKYHIGPWEQCEMVRLAALQVYAQRNKDGRKLAFCGAQEDNLCQHWIIERNRQLSEEKGFREGMKWFRDSLSNLDQENLWFVPSDIMTREAVEFGK